MDLCKFLKSSTVDMNTSFCLIHLYAKLKKNFGGGTFFINLMMDATYYETYEAKMIQVK